MHVSELLSLAFLLRWYRGTSWWWLTGAYWFQVRSLNTGESITVSWRSTASAGRQWPFAWVCGTLPSASHLTPPSPGTRMWWRWFTMAIWNSTVRNLANGVIAAKGPKNWSRSGTGKKGTNTNMEEKERRCEGRGGRIEAKWTIWLQGLREAPSGTPFVQKKIATHFLNWMKTT